MKKIILVQFTKTVSQLPYDETRNTPPGACQGPPPGSEGATISVSGDVGMPTGNRGNRRGTGNPQLKEGC
jgi:hypothetical protein